jgi:precorrin-6B methylase 2
MGDRHINLLANFIDLFPVSLEDFRYKYVFDIGCWTGGTTLLLAALAKKVYAIEEVKKYAEIVSFLLRSFDLMIECQSRHYLSTTAPQRIHDYSILLFPR